MQEQLIRELLEKTEQGNRLQKRHTLVLMVCAVLLVVLIGALVWFGSSVSQIGDTLAQFDVSALEGSLQQVEQQLGKLDVDALNDTLQKTSEAASNMQKAAENFEAFSEGFGNLFRPR